MRPPASVSGTRCTRCTPDSNFSRAKAPSPCTWTASSHAAQIGFAEARSPRTANCADRRSADTSAAGRRRTARPPRPRCRGGFPGSRGVRRRMSGQQRQPQRLFHRAGRRAAPRLLQRQRPHLGVGQRLGLGHEQIIQETDARSSLRTRARLTPRSLSPKRDRAKISRSEPPSAGRISDAGVIGKADQGGPGDIGGEPALPRQPRGARGGKRHGVQPGGGLGGRQGQAQRFGIAAGGHR
jgi:hypothetical protein